MSKYPELITIRDVIRFATSRFYEAGLFYGHGTDNAWDDAAALILRTLYLPHSVTPHVLDARITASEKDTLLARIDLRVTKRIPVAYLIHEAWFAGLSFYVDERVLIPRSPLAELIETGFSPWISPESVHRVLDLCTGSGCIAIAIAKHLPQVTVDASDISEEALAVAKNNILRHECMDQVNLIQSDLFTQIPPVKYDIIVSNPPYVSAEEMQSLPDEYRHEPSLGLSAGPDGLDFVRIILKKARSFLSDQGILIVEVGNSDIALQDTFPNIPFTWLEFERGGGGVFLLSAKDLEIYQTQIC